MLPDVTALRQRSYIVTAAGWGFSFVPAADSSEIQLLFTVIQREADHIISARLKFGLREHGVTIK